MPMPNQWTLTTCCLALFLVLEPANGMLLQGEATGEERRPNVVLILCDDLGIGDVQCFNPDHGKIKTPFIDQLAKEGISFTDAHSGSSVCTPTLPSRWRWSVCSLRWCGSCYPTKPQSLIRLVNFKSRSAKAFRCTSDFSKTPEANEWCLRPS